MTQPSIPLIEQIDALLPQTQCGQCDHDGCLPYAQAMANGEAHNKCPPGGHATLLQLEQLLGRTPLTLRLPSHKQPGIKFIASIREEDCIGCTKCIQACPVDAIIGARQLMHSVLEDDCTGCELCIAPCPVDCIDLITPPAHWLSPSLEDSHDKNHDQVRAQAARSRQRYHVHQQRLTQQKARRLAEKQQRLERAKLQHATSLPSATVTAEPSTPAHNLNTKALKTAFNMAQKQFRDASQALNKAERDGRTDLEPLQERVMAFEQKMERAKAAWQLASGNDWQDHEQNP